MKAEWQQTTLKELCAVDWGNTNLTKSSYTEGGKFLAVSAAGCDGRIAHFEHLKHTPVLSAIGAQCGKMFFPLEDFTAIKNTITLTPRSGKSVGKFLYYLFTIIDLPKRGAGQPFISKGDIEKFPVSFPQIAEQERIVAILDEAFEGIETAVANAEKNLANARELFEIYLNSVFCEKGIGRTEKNFSEICEITTRLVDPREPEFIDLLHLGAGNMISLTGEVIDVKTAREEGLKSGKFLFDSRMVLYSKIRPYLMKACRPQFSGLCSADVYPLLPNQQHLNRDFLFYILVSRGFTDYAIAGSDRAGMPKVNRDHLFRYKTWLPPVAEQKQIASKLDVISGECRRLEANYLQKLAFLEELKRVILHKAFAGELTARSVKTMQAAE